MRFYAPIEHSASCQSILVLTHALFQTTMKSCETSSDKSKAIERFSFIIEMMPMVSVGHLGMEYYVTPVDSVFDWTFRRPFRTTVERRRLSESSQLAWIVPLRKLCNLSPPLCRFSRPGKRKSSSSKDNSGNLSRSCWACRLP